MKTLQVNIGLNNNPMTNEGVITYIASLQGYRLMGYYLTTKIYKGVAELTVVAVFQYKYARQSKVLQDWENIASDMHQECIAVSTDYFEALAFSPSYTGKPLRFSSRQFEYMKIHILPNCE